MEKPKKKFLSKYRKYLTIEHAEKLLFDPNYITPTCIVLFIFETILNVFIIERVNYTEIDWIAYMQEIEGILNGTWDYQYIKGNKPTFFYLLTKVSF